MLFHKKLQEDKKEASLAEEAKKTERKTELLEPLYDFDKQLGGFVGIKGIVFVLYENENRAELRVIGSTKLKAFEVDSGSVTSVKEFFEGKGFAKAPFTAKGITIYAKS
ncbi:MAG: hypothetical protein ACP5T3_01540 [Candidatus Micrarchaeia archaeon]